MCDIHETLRFIIFYENVQVFINLFSFLSNVLYIYFLFLKTLSQFLHGKTLSRKSKKIRKSLKILKFFLSPDTSTSWYLPKSCPYCWPHFTAWFKRSWDSPQLNPCAFLVVEKNLKTLEGNWVSRKSSANLSAPVMTANCQSWPVFSLAGMKVCLILWTIYFFHFSFLFIAVVIN